MRCPSCAGDNREQASFCGHCGAPLALRCPACGAGVQADTRFCDACGHKLARAVAVGADLSQAERKTVTALFADIRGFTALSENLDPEDVRSFIDPAIELMMQAVHRYDGFVAQSLGDGIFALFGAPIAHEDHAQRALHAALAMQDGIRQRDATGQALQVRVGVNTGEVVVRSMRKDAQHSDYVPIGHSVNLASRMENLATPGSILVSEHTYRLAEGYFNFRDWGEVTVKGVREPVRTYEVIGLGPLRTRLERAEKRGLVGFVGREAELEAMAVPLAQVREGRGAIIAIRGEPGLGKSRLCYEFSRRHLAHCLVLKTFSVSHGKANAYQALISLLQHYFGWRPEDDAARRRQRVRERVHALDPQLEETLPYLFHLLGISEPGVSLAQMDPEIRRWRTFQAIEQLLRRESARQPVVLIFEDLQWADRETLAFLAGFSRKLARDAVLLVVNFRPEYEDPFWDKQLPCTELRLAPLAEEGGAALLGALLGAAPALQPLKRRLLEETGGNPLFLEEIARELLEQGIVRPEAGDAALAQALPDVRIPPTVQSVIAARIDRLRPEAKSLLQTLAVIGRQFTLELVQRVTELEEGAARAQLQALLEAGFLLQSAQAAAPRYEIKHGLIQEVAYRLLLKEQRRALHERVAQALERMFAAALAEHYSELAHHYYSSANVPKAIEYLALAGQQAAQRSANEEAVQQLRRALELLQQLPESPQRDARELGLQLAIGAPLMRSRGWADPELGRSRARALALAEPLKESPQMFPALFGLWGYSLVRAEVGTARKLAEQAAALADKVGDAGLQVEACRALVPSLYFQGELAAASAAARRGIALYDRRQHAGHAVLFGQDPCVSCFSYHGVVLHLLGLTDQACRSNEQALELASALGHPYTLGFAQFFSACLYFQRHEDESAFHAASAAVETCAEHGFPLWRAGAAAIRGWARARRGELAAGIEEIKRGMSDWRATGAEVTRPYFLAMLAEACAGAGRREEALAAAAEGITLAQANRETWWLADLYRIQAELLDGAEAEQSFQRCLEVARAQGALMMELRAAASCLRLAKTASEKAEWRALLRDVHGRFGEGHNAPDLREAAVLLAG